MQGVKKLNPYQSLEKQKSFWAVFIVTVKNAITKWLVTEAEKLNKRQ